MTVLTLPGYQDSGPAHWQSRWEADRPDVRRVRQDDWERPVCGDWVRRLGEAVETCDGEVLVAAHSLGCLLLVHWVASGGHGIAGALLVAVPDPDGPAFPADTVGFDPVPTVTLPFPALVVASGDDPYAGMAFSQRVARGWGAELVDVGRLGHINGTSGLGAWDEGWGLLGRVAPG